MTPGGRSLDLAWVGMSKKAASLAWALGNHIRNLRQSRGWTMQQLVQRAEDLGIRLPWRTLSDLERGQRRDPQLSTLLAVAATLGVELSRLVSVLDNNAHAAEEEQVMHRQKKANNATEALQEKIRKKDLLIRKYKKEAEAFDASDVVGNAVIRYCLGLARWHEEEQGRLEAELRKMHENPDRNRMAKG
jgi:transcriptional regulator with XRE-family HTH domain